jgi:ABC-type Fe3+-hydroxamate transport system substrate-binding protein
MVAGQNTFINDMLGRCSMENAFGAESGSRYPELSTEDISAAGLDAILLASEPFPFGSKHRAAFAEQFSDVPVHLVDGEMLSWYGSRLLLAVDYFRELLDTLE